MERSKVHLHIISIFLIFYNVFRKKSSDLNEEQGIKYMNDCFLE